MNREAEELTTVFGEFKTRFYAIFLLFGQSLWLSCFGQELGVWNHTEPTQQGDCQGNGLGFQAVHELLMEELPLFPGS